MNEVGLTGRNVRLRALLQADLETLRLFVNNPTVMQYANTYSPINDWQQARWFESMSRDEHSVWFGVDHHSAGAYRLVGTCCLVALDWVGRSAELRIRLGDPNVWGQGVGSAATELLLAYGFHHLNLNRIWLRVLANNPRAIRLYEKTGFQVEGRLRQHVFIGGAHQDMVLMGLLRSEWPRPDNTAENL